MAKYIGETNQHLKEGSYYALMTQDMAGRIYKPGKDERGKWLDTVGEQDTRIMVWVNANSFYKVYNSGDEFLKEWVVEGTFNQYSHRLREAISKKLATV